MRSGRKKQPLVLPTGFSGKQLQELRETTTTRRALRKKLEDFSQKVPVGKPAPSEAKDRAAESQETKKPDSEVPLPPKTVEEKPLEEVKEPESLLKQPPAETFATLYSQEDLRELAKNKQLPPSLVKKYLKDKD